MERLQKFDIHIASDVMSPELEQRLIGLRYRRDDFAGGTADVARPHHFSYHPESKSEFNDVWAATVIVLAKTKPEEFFGFMEGETTSGAQEALLTYKPFDTSVPFPFGKLEHEECPPNKRKDYDIHVSAELATIDPQLRSLLEDKIEFYYADIRKSTGKVVRVYTFQPLGVPKSMELFRLLLDYFQRAGGLAGKLKVEVTLDYARFPETVRVPPVITRAPIGID